MTIKSKTKQKKKDLRSLTEKRNDFLKSRGYTVKGYNKPSPKPVSKLSHYAQQVVSFIKAKRKKSFEVYRTEDGRPIRNRQGIPFYKS